MDTPNENPRLLSLDEIMAAPDIRREIVDMPEWGGAIEIQGLSLEQTEAIRAEATVIVPGPGGSPGKDLDSDKFAYGLLAASAVNPPMTVEQARDLRKKAAVPMDRLFKRVLAISGLTKEAAQQAEKSPSA